MQDPGDICKDLPPELDDCERDRLVALALRLHTQKPLPDLSFRGELRKTLLGVPPSRTDSVFSRPTVVVPLLYAAAGMLLLGTAALGIAGTGPFAVG